MSKFEKVQLWLSFIPFYSTYFIFFATMVQLKRFKARFGTYALFYISFLLIFGGGSVLSMATQELFKSELARYIVLCLIFTVGNFLWVKMQTKARKVFTEK